MVAKIKSLLLANTSQSQTVAKNALWLGAGSLAGRALRAGFLVIVARALAPEDWGAFTYVLSLAALLSVVADLGLNATITRESAKNRESQVRYFATGLAVKCAGTAALVGGTLLLAPPLLSFEAVRSLVPLLAAIVAVDALRDFGMLVTRAWERMELEAMVQVTTNVAIVVCGAVALHLSPTPWSVAAGYAAGAAVGLVPAYWPLRRYLVQVPRAWDRELVGPLLKASWPYAMLSAMGALLLNTDTLMIGWLMDLRAVGWYGAVQRVALFVYVVPGPVAAALFPSMAKAAADRAEFRKLLERALAVLTLLGAPLAAGGAVLASSITVALYGREYLGAAPAFTFMALAFLPYFYSTVLSNAVFAAKREKQLFWYVVLGVAGNFALNLALIPVLGIRGAALGTAINQAAVTAYLWWRVQKVTPFSIRETAPKALVAAVAMAAAVALFDLFSPSVFLTIPVGAAAYLGMLLLLEEPLTAKLAARLRATRA